MIDEVFARLGDESFIVQPSASEFLAQAPHIGLEAGTHAIP